MLPPEYRTVKQRLGSKLCGACVVAMATGHSLARICTFYHIDMASNDSYMRIRQLLGYLGECGIHAGFYFECDNWRVDSMAPLKGEWNWAGMPAILTVHSRNLPGFLHYVFWDGAHVRDPDPRMPETTHLEDYVTTEILPLYYFEETTP